MNLIFVRKLYFLQVVLLGWKWHEISQTMFSKVERLVYYEFMFIMFIKIYYKVIFIIYIWFEESWGYVY